jgi:signal transduction histidine kinase
LREVDRLKSEFLASMSHELRTPLNSIIGYAEVLLDGIDGDLGEEMREDVGAIHGSGKHLLNLINDILDLAKIEAGQMDLIRDNVELKPLVQEVMTTAKVLLMGKPVDLVVDIDESLPLVDADALRLRQILSNLITNAIKFTQEGSITVRAEPHEADPSLLLVSVIDTGIGIKAEHLPLVFERFRQVDQSATRRVGGTGLGLAITRQLVQMHGGDLWVQSEVGVGSIFTFTMPAAQVSEMEA